MKIPDGTIEEINRNVNIADVVADYVTLERKGNRYMGLCPFHTEKTPSFSVTPDKNLFYCFGCHKGGNMFTFVMEMEHIPFQEAAEKLAQRAGIELNLDSYTREEQSQRQALSDLYNKLSGSFHYFLTEHSMGGEALGYLKSRGVREEIISQFNLGFVPQKRTWLYEFLKGKNYSDGFLSQSGLFSRKYPESSLFNGRLVFPIYNAGGQVIAFGGRSIDGRDPKYINSPETDLFKKRQALFGLYQAVKGVQEQKTTVIVEGYFDVLAMFQAGLPYAVAPLGTALTEEQTRMLHRYANKAILVFDDDAAGVRAVWRGLELMEKTGLETEVAVPKGGKDPADILLNEGSNSLQNMLKSKTNGFSFLVGKAIELHGSKDAHAKTMVLESLAPYLKNIESEVKREEYVKHLADILHAGTEAVQSDLQAILQGKRTRKEGQEAITDNKMEIGSDLFLMLAVVVNCEYFPRMRQSVDLNELQSKSARELYIALEEAFRDDMLDIDHVIPRIEDQKLQELIFEKAATGEFELNAESIIRDGINTIRIRSLKQKRDEIIYKMKSMDRNGAHRDVQKELLSEKMFLDEELKRIKEEAQ